MKKTLFIPLLFFAVVLSAQTITQKRVAIKNYPYEIYFQKAYQQFLDVPKGMLEAVAYTMTHLRHIDSTDVESCTGMPRVYGVMGLTLDGKNYFRNNLNYISQLSGYTANYIISSPEINILAYAKAYSTLLNNNGTSSKNIEEHVPVLVALSELPDSNLQSNFALNSHLYSVLTFLNSQQNQMEYSFPNYNINLENVFGEENLKVLSAPNIIISEDTIIDKNGNQFQKKNGNHIPIIFSTDYGPAIWNPTTCNYSSRNGTAISAITIHTVQGSYSGCISWFKNCSSSVSAHYVIRSSDGQVTQMVLESNKAWHVGSENPYTIGYEHEGYVNDASWYTSAMYNNSADLSRDVINSGYGIDGLRTGFWPWLATTYYNQSGIPGSCCRIKGHMHYPNQTHSDPGPNWNWDRYYKLINNNPSVTTYTTATGTFYDSGGSSGNYSDDERKVYVINPSGATSVTLTFTSFNLENTWDYIYIYDGNDVWSPLIGYYTGTNSPGTITSSGGAITVEFRSDCATTASGWAVNWTSSGGAVVPTNLLAAVANCNTVNLSWNNSGSGWYIDVSTSPNFTTFYNKNISNQTSTTCPTGFCDYPNCTQTLTLQSNTTYYWRIWNGSSHTSGGSFTTPDCIIPTTAIAAPSNWITGNFTANFNDADNVGVEKSFYCVYDNNGNEWRANNTRGFFYDEFPVAIHPDWTVAVGTWNIANGTLVQSDEVEGNTNIYAPLTQNLSNRYLYRWQGKIEGTGTGRRAGFHFFCDDGSLPNRGNSYFVWFRLDDQKLQFYKVTNDVFSLTQEKAVSLSAGTWYDFKVIYDRITGKMSVYVNDNLIDTWTDASPYSNGSYISFRSGNAKWTVDNLEIFRSRAASVNITVGAASTNDIRYQNPNLQSPSGSIGSIVNDADGNLSSIIYQNLNIDWTPPSDVAANDGSSSDIDTTNIATELSANWTTSIDTHSTINSYWYSIGIAQGDTSIAGWTNNGISVSVTHTGLSLNYGTTYFFNVKVKNGAGLFSNETYSDGQILVQPFPPPTANFSTANNTICNGETINFQNTSLDATNYEWAFQSGNPATSTASNPAVTYTATGNYSVTLIAYSNGNTSDTLTQNISVTVNPTPNAAFSVDSTTVYQPNTTVNFTNNSTDATSFFWDFGDGITSTQQNPTHTYPDTGFYTIIFIASNGLCNDDTLIMTNYIYVGTDPSITVPVASFQYSGSGFICAGDSVSFFNSSSDANSYEWIFSGGSPSTSNATNPSVLFSLSGSYSVTLIATGPGGVDTLQQNITVNVVSPPIADFSANDTIAYLPNATINFVNLSDDATNFEWNFGDGNNSFISDPSHTFADSGYYTITLVAGNDNCPNDTNTFINYIYVFTPIPAPVAAFTNSSTTICVNGTINFTSNSSDATSFQWTFQGGNPSTSSLQNPSVSYNASGNYPVTLIATGPGGSDTLTQNISVTVEQFSSAAFSVNDTVIMENEIVYFTNLSNNAGSYFWNFGDGSFSTGDNPWHQYADTGSFTVILIASNGICANDTLTMTNYIYVQSAVGENQLEVENWKLEVSPNPSNGIFTISFPLNIKHQTSNISIYNLLGEIVYSKQFENPAQVGRTTNKQPDIYRVTTNLSSGIYFLQLKGENFFESFKLVIR